MGFESLSMECWIRHVFFAVSLSCDEDDVSCRNESKGVSQFMVSVIRFES